MRFQNSIKEIHEVYYYSLYFNTFKPERFGSVVDSMLDN